MQSGQLTIWRIIAIAVALISPGLMYGQSTPSCSNSNLSGAFGFRVTGTNNAVPYALFGRFVADGKGNVKTGAAIQNFGGSILRAQFSAVYSVAQDCTGQSIFTFSDGTTAYLDFTIEANGTQVSLIVTGPANGAAIIEYGVATKQFIDQGIPLPREESGSVTP